MALSLSLSLSLPTPMVALAIPPSLKPPSPSAGHTRSQLSFRPRSLALTPRLPLRRPTASTLSWRRAQVVCMAPDEQKLTRRSPLDFPIEWERPKPAGRPDIFPQFSPMKTPLPPPMPFDPPLEDDEEEENKEEEEEPEKEETEEQQ